MDNLSPEARRRTMQRVKGRNTPPEMVVRRACHALGYRYRLHRSDLPGKPDLVFPGRGKVVFVHGCFWHRHRCPSGRSCPATRREYWTAKFDRNRRRDQRVRRRLNRQGWGVMVVWECQTRPSKLPRLLERIQAFLDE